MPGDLFMSRRTLLLITAGILTACLLLCRGLLSDVQLDLDARLKLEYNPESDFTDPYSSDNNHLLRDCADHLHWFVQVLLHCYFQPDSVVCFMTGFWRKLSWFDCVCRQDAMLKMHQVSMEHSCLRKGKILVHYITVVVRFTTSTTSTTPSLPPTTLTVLTI